MSYITLFFIAKSTFHVWDMCTDGRMKLKLHSVRLIIKVQTTKGMKKVSRAQIFCPFQV
jgi:hypothetical protein